jgi:hypothetical protein
MTTVNTPDLVTKTRWWTISGVPDSVMSWESVHPPKDMTSGGSGSETTGLWQSSELMVTFEAPPIPAVLPSRQLLVQAAGMAGGRTVIRVDAQDTWLPAKPAAEAIPPAAVLTIRAGYPSRSPMPRPVSPGSHTRPAATAPAVMSITDRAVITRAANLVAALPVTGPGVRHCPAAFGGSLNLTFASPNGAALAKVAASASGCGSVSVVVHGASQPGLSGGPELIGQLGSLLHVRWPGLS